MVTAAVVAVMFLGSHGEPSREVKFGGALLAQADAADVNVPALQRELDELVRTKPNYLAAGIVLASGGGVGLLMVALVIVGTVVAGWDGVAVALVGVLLGLTGIVVLAIGLIMLIAGAVERAEYDTRIERLRAKLPPPMPPSASMASEGGVVLARF